MVMASPYHLQILLNIYVGLLLTQYYLSVVTAKCPVLIWDKPHIDSVALGRGAFGLEQHSLLFNTSPFFVCKPKKARLLLEQPAYWSGVANTIWTPVGILKINPVYCHICWKEL